MPTYLIFIFIGAVVSVILFAYMRNRQAKRNDKRRERLWKRQEELLELLERTRKEENK